MYRSRVFHSGVLAALLLISLNCSAQKVSTTTENRFDFKSGKRYAWGKKITSLPAKGVPMMR
jgi:hypothetical protein